MNRLSNLFTGSKCNFYGGKTSWIGVIWQVFHNEVNETPLQFLWWQNFLNRRQLTNFSKRYCTLISWWQNFLNRRHLTSFSRHWVCEKKNLKIYEKSTFWFFCFDFIQISCCWVVKSDRWRLKLSQSQFSSLRQRRSWVWPVGQFCFGSWFFLKFWKPVETWNSLSWKQFSDQN